MNLMITKSDAVVPTAAEIGLAEKASHILASQVQGDELRVHLDDGREMTIPQSATRLLFHLLTEMAHGNAVTLIPIHAEMTTQEAADFLNVSRPFLIGLLDANVLPYRKVGTHRRIRFQDVKGYRDRIDAERERTLDELAAQAQELGMGY